MGCEGFRRRIDPYFDGELPEDDRKELEAHIAGCDACRGALEELRMTWEALDAYEVVGAIPSSGSDVLRRARGIERRWRLARIGAGVAAAILIGLLLWQPLMGPRGDELSPSDEMEIVTNWEVLDNLDLLESLEVLENLDLLEEMPADLLNGSEQG